MAHLATYVGCIYMAPVDDDGTLLGPWEELGEAYPLSIQLTDEDPVTIKGRTCKTWNKVIGTKAQAGAATGSVTLYEYTAGNVSRALKGLVTVNNVSGSTLNDEEVALKDVGGFVDIGSELLSDVVVTTSLGTPLVAGTDYDLNPVLGLIAPLTDAVANTTVKISATVGEDRESRITIGAGQSAKFAIRGNLINEFSNKNVRLRLRKVLVSSRAEVNFVSAEDTDREQLELTLTPEIPTGQSDYGTIDGLPLR